MNLRKAKHDQSKEERKTYAARLAKIQKKLDRKAEHERRAERVKAQREHYGAERFDRMTSGSGTYHSFAPDGREAINPRGRYKL